MQAEFGEDVAGWTADQLQRRIDGLANFLEGQLGHSFGRAAVVRSTSAGVTVEVSSAAVTIGGDIYELAAYTTLQALAAAVNGAGKAYGMEVNPQVQPDTPITVPLRHAWATPVDLPYNGPMEEFARKRTRNDYTLMRLRQMGIHHVRVPVSDLIDPQIRARMEMFARTGIRFALFSLGVPDGAARALINAHRDFVTQLEIVRATDDLCDIAGDLDKLADLGDLKIVVGKSHSSKHEPKQGSRFAHSVSSGFKWEARETVLEAVRSLADFARIDGLVMQINLTDDLGRRLGEMAAFARASGLTIDANVRLANPNPAIANFDDAAIARRVGEAVEAASSLTAVSVHIDTFVDVDRGYNPRHGLLDRHYNFRPAGRALATERTTS